MCLSFQLSRRDVQQFGVLPACTPHQFFASHLCGVPPLADLENRRRPFKCFSFARGHSVRWGQVGSGDVAEPLKEEGPSLPGRAGRLQPPTLRILTPASSSCARPSPSAPGGSGGSAAAPAQQQRWPPQPVAARTCWVVSCRALPVNGFNTGAWTFRRFCQCSTAAAPLSREPVAFAETPGSQPSAGVGSSFGHCVSVHRGTAAP